MTMIGSPLSGRSGFTTLAALVILARLLPFGPAASAAATEIATLASNELSRVGQSFKSMDMRARRTSCSLDGPTDPPTSTTLLTPRLAYRAEKDDDQPLP